MRWIIDNDAKLAGGSKIERQHGHEIKQHEERQVAPSSLEDLENSIGEARRQNVHLDGRNVFARTCMGLVHIGRADSEMYDGR
jgi:hypothetical protein